MHKLILISEDVYIIFSPTSTYRFVEIKPM